MVQKRKLKLEILDSKENVTVTHHFFYDVKDEHSLRLIIGDNIYRMDNDGNKTD